MPDLATLRADLDAVNRAIPFDAPPTFAPDPESDPDRVPVAWGCALALVVSLACCTAAWTALRYVARRLVEAVF